jgi:heptosyltransferase-2
MRIAVRATNWVGDAVMSLPALAAVRRKFPDAHIAVVARPWVSDLYGEEPFADEIIPYVKERRGETVRRLRDGKFDAALLLQNAFDAAWLVWRARIPQRIGYARDARGWLLTTAARVPGKGEIPEHETYYYLELLRRAGWLEALPERVDVRLQCAARMKTDAARSGRRVVGVSPGAAYGSAKRWIPERFAESAVRVAGELGAEVEVHGSREEAELCAQVSALIAARGVRAGSWAGRTSLKQFMERVAGCEVMLTNDSGAMHIAYALGVPTVAVFGATNHVTTGPSGDHAAVVRKPVECAPCLLRECPIDHRCMTQVSAEEVARTALRLVQR